MSETVFMRHPVTGGEFEAQPSQVPSLKRSGWQEADRPALTDVVVSVPSVAADGEIPEQAAQGVPAPDEKTTKPSRSRRGETPEEQ